ncbi:HDOD domain-containing protein [Desulfovibrio sp. OttesenSCG-928-F20]|nr:HDOD domain-containing protein [Desulfovibrio sp. OttesenSCG-928-M16]MDL2291002.1 HDOD domain-containing protein [Desulfovibrio sp. OttesenSCG-928-F20]
MNTVRLEEARAFLEELSDNPPWLPYEPMLLPQLFAATKEDSTASVDDLTLLIERSQKLATRVLSLANSALYALESTVTSLRRAVSILGFREVRTLVVMIGAVSAIKGAKLPKEFDANELWRHQVNTASLAKGLTMAMSSLPENGLEMAPDEAYAAGLLHDIGKVFLAAGRPAIWAEIENLRREKNISFFEAENEYWGMDHALIGAQVLHYWKLPLLLTDPINWHHAPDVAPAFGAEARLLAAANLLAHDGLPAEGPLPDFVLAMLPAGVNPEKAATIVREAVAKTRSEYLAGMMD